MASTPMEIDSPVPPSGLLGIGRPANGIPAPAATAKLSEMIQFYHPTKVR
jgi:hypothetical protein